MESDMVKSPDRSLNKSFQRFWPQSLAMVVSVTLCAYSLHTKHGACQAWFPELQNFIYPLNFMNTFPSNLLSTMCIKQMPVDTFKQSSNIIVLGDI